MSDLSSLHICSTADYGYEDEPVGPAETSWDDVRYVLDQMALEKGDWEGIPAPIDGQRVVLYDRHRLAAFYTTMGPAGEFSCSVDDVCEEETIVNSWFSRKLNAEVYVVRRGPKTFALKMPVSPDQAMTRLTFWLKTLGATDAWGLDAEYKAREKLRGMLAEHQWRRYDLTGSFLETSPRSKLTYMFRRLRPTVVLSPRWPETSSGRTPDSMRCLAVLCMHATGYYAESWAGCLTPSDDVIAHLLWMRGDEAGYWGAANQHDPAAPEAGL